MPYEIAVYDPVRREYYVPSEGGSDGVWRNELVLGSDRRISFQVIAGYDPLTGAGAALDVTKVFGADATGTAHVVDGDAVVTIAKGVVTVSALSDNLAGAVVVAPSTGDGFGFASSLTFDAAAGTHHGAANKGDWLTITTLGSGETLSFQAGGTTVALAAPGDVAALTDLGDVRISADGAVQFRMADAAAYGDAASFAMSIAGADGLVVSGDVEIYNLDPDEAMTLNASAGVFSALSLGATGDTGGALALAMTAGHDGDGDQARAHEHKALFRLMPLDTDYHAGGALEGETGAFVAPTHTAIRSGDWFDPATWGGAVPGEGAIVHVPETTTVSYDLGSPAYAGFIAGGGNPAADSAVFMIRVDGELDVTADHGTETVLVVDTLFSTPGSTLTIDGDNADGAGIEVVIQPFDIEGHSHGWPQSAADYYVDGPTDAFVKDSLDIEKFVVKITENGKKTDCVQDQDGNIYMFAKNSDGEVVAYKAYAVEDLPFQTYEQEGSGQVHSISAADYKALLRNDARAYFRENSDLFPDYNNEHASLLRFDKGFDKYTEQIIPGLGDGSGVLGRWSWDAEQLGLGIVTHGETRIQGQDKVAHLKTAADSVLAEIQASGDAQISDAMRAGSDKIVIEIPEAYQGISSVGAILDAMHWSAGDQILIGGTGLAFETIGTEQDNRYAAFHEDLTQDEVASLSATGHQRYGTDHLILEIENVRSFVPGQTADGDFEVVETLSDKLQYDHTVYTDPAELDPSQPDESNKFSATVFGNGSERDQELRDGLKASIANLSRNVTVRSEVATDQDPDGGWLVEDATQVRSQRDLDADGHLATQRGHMMVMHTTDTVDISNTAFLGLGRTDKSEALDDYVLVGDDRVIGDDGNYERTPDAEVLNMRGRYALHVHRTGFDGEAAAELDGNVVWGSPSWGYVHHDSWANLTDNIAFDINGSAFNSETGNEIGTWRHNLAVKSRESGQSDRGDATKEKAFSHTNHDWGFTGIGYWLEGHGVDLVDNIAVSSQEAGYWVAWSGIDGLDVRTDLLDLPEGINLERQELVDGRTQGQNAQLSFIGNESVSSIYGLYWAGDKFDDSSRGFGNTNDLRSKIVDFTAWEVLGYGAYIWDASNITVDGFVAAGSGIAKEELREKSGELFLALTFYKRSVDSTARNIEYDNFAGAAGLGIQQPNIAGGIDFTNVYGSEDDQFVRRSVEFQTSYGIRTSETRTVTFEQDGNGFTVDNLPQVSETFVEGIANAPRTIRSEIKTGGVLKSGPLSAEQEDLRFFIEMTQPGVTLDSDKLVMFKQGESIGRNGTELHVYHNVVPMLNVRLGDGLDAVPETDDFFVAFGQRSGQAAYSSDATGTQTVGIVEYPNGDTEDTTPLMAGTTPVELDYLQVSNFLLRGGKAHYDSLDADGQAAFLAQSLDQDAYLNEIRTVVEETGWFDADVNGKTWLTGLDHLNEATRTAQLDQLAATAVNIYGVKNDSLGATYEPFVGQIAPYAENPDEIFSHRVGFSYDRLGYEAAVNGYYLIDGLAVVVMREAYTDRGTDTVHLASLPVSLGGLAPGGATEAFLTAAIDRHNPGESITAQRLGSFDNLVVDQNLTARDGHLVAENGASLILSNFGDDTLDGSAQGDVLFGGIGDNLIRAGAGADRVDGHAGDDSILGGAGIDTLNGGAGADTMDGGADWDLIDGGAGDDRVIGEDGSDFLAGGSGNDVLYGGQGNDVLEGGDGVDHLYGGTNPDNSVESDLAAYFSADGPLIFDFGSDITVIQNGSSAAVRGDIIGDDIEGIAGADQFSNTFLADEMTGLTFFMGGRQGDTFHGGSGTDQLLGLGGDDVIHGNAGMDALIGEGGDDQLYGGAGADFFFFDGANEGDDTIHDFESGVDTIYFTHGRISMADLTFTAGNYGGTAATDTLVTYEYAGVAQSITILDIAPDAAEEGFFI